jgi:hypothetical protein
MEVKFLEHIPACRKRLYQFIAIGRLHAHVLSDPTEAGADKLLCVAARLQFLPGIVRKRRTSMRDVPIGQYGRCAYHRFTRS